MTRNILINYTVTNIGVQEALNPVYSQSAATNAKIFKKEGNSYLKFRLSSPDPKIDDQTTYQLSGLQRGTNINSSNGLFSIHRSEMFVMESISLITNHVSHINLEHEQVDNFRYIACLNQCNIKEFISRH